MALEARFPSEQRRVQPEEVSFTPTFGELCGGLVNIALTGKISILSGSKWGSNDSLSNGLTLSNAFLRIILLLCFLVAGFLIRKPWSRS